MKYYKYTFMFTKRTYGSTLYYRVTDDNCVEFYREPDCEHAGGWLRSAFVSDEEGLIKKAENSEDKLEIATDENMFSRWLMEELVS